MGKRTIKLTLAYDGTHFCGWQTQKQGERTVQKIVETALAELHNHEIKLYAAGRTDSGVHATGQVAHFHSGHRSLAPEQFTDAINSHLPHDVRVLKSEQVPESFHARFSAKARLYRYYLYSSPVGLPHYRRFCWRIRKILNINSLNALARPLVGSHDFTSFSSTKDPSTSKEREVFTSCFYTLGPFIVYEIRANAFLWKMVRTILGTIITLALQENTPDMMFDTLQAKDRSSAGPTAPARGLFLEGVRYG
ncbi:MAG: tRNA pseudouridine(38-40) synthase TruA [Spirochaetales bacterium]|nr:tRNA pseudouridine(38-40) synthase TruA [Spirochaetales bacterium]